MLSAWLDFFDMQIAEIQTQNDLSRENLWAKNNWTLPSGTGESNAQAVSPGLFLSVSALVGFIHRQSYSAATVSFKLAS